MVVIFHCILKISVFLLVKFCSSHNRRKCFISMYLAKSKFLYKHTSHDLQLFCFISEELTWKVLVLTFSSSDILRFFAGPLCEENINECSSSPCLNKGVCVDDVAGYRCTCVKGYIGRMSPFFLHCLKVQ